MQHNAKQDNSKLTTRVNKTVLKCEARICRALVLYTQGKRSTSSLRSMIAELEHVEFAKNMNKKL